MNVKIKDFEVIDYRLYESGKKIARRCSATVFITDKVWSWKNFGMIETVSETPVISSDGIYIGIPPRQV